MRILLILPILFITSGCMLTRRLDRMSDQLGVISSQLEEANHRLATVEGAAGEFPKIHAELEDANKKLTRMDELAARVAKMFGVEAPPKKQ